MYKVRAKVICNNTHDKKAAATSSLKRDSVTPQGVGASHAAAAGSGPDAARSRIREIITVGDLLPYKQKLKPDFKSHILPGGLQRPCLWQQIAKYVYFAWCEAQVSLSLIISVNTKQIHSIPGERPACWVPWLAQRPWRPLVRPKGPRAPCFIRKGGINNNNNNNFKLVGGRVGWGGVLNGPCALRRRCAFFSLDPGCRPPFRPRCAGHHLGRRVAPTRGSPQLTSAVASASAEAWPASRSQT